MQRQFQEYDIPANEEVNAGDVRTMPNGSKWLVESATVHGNSETGDYKIRLRVIPDTPANRKRIAHLEQE